MSGSKCEHVPHTVAVTGQLSGAGSLLLFQDRLVWQASPLAEPSSQLCAELLEKLLSEAVCTSLQTLASSKTPASPCPSFCSPLKWKLVVGLFVLMTHGQVTNLHMPIKNTLL